ncbi:hypothetical protein F2Q68_00018760 [Brassica cretica]|uniref:Ionotropic glutamate receptor C-terminal domain-containing protein n=1 Tax=Brassica cretica TaxID=69181 RepID=A0A8S9G1Y1_BRACR|nr:hypothetical protein F2Q68_00018760 [Brassica cretica]
MKRFGIQNAILLVSFLFVQLLFTCFASSQNDDVYEDSASKWVRIRVGLVLDMDSLEGKMVGRSVTTALSDFYAINTDHKTRVSLSIRNSHGEPLLALASGNVLTFFFFLCQTFTHNLCVLSFAAVDLLHTVGVEAIIICGDSILQTKLLAEIGEKAKVPVISINSPISSSLSRYNHLIQATHDSSSEAKGITAFIHEFDWKSVALVYEDDDDWRESMQIMVDHFYENGVGVLSKAGFAVSSTEEMVMDRLGKMKDLGTSVFVVHMSEVIATRLFTCAERLGMMGEGFAWILTAKSMSSSFYGKEAMEGVVGFKTYIPMSRELQNFTLRLRTSLGNGDDVRLSVSGVWAHDVAWALARSAEMVNASSTLLDAITECRFKGLSGDFQVKDKKFLSDKFEIVNLLESGERRIGFWNGNGSFSSRRHFNKLETIIWPGGSAQTPGGRVLGESKRRKLRVLVTSSNRFPSLMEVDTDLATNVTTVKGFCIEVFQAAIAPFNYDLEFIPWRNGSNYDNLAIALSTQRFGIQNPILVSLLVLFLFFDSSSQNDDVYQGSGSDNERVRIRVGLVLDLDSLEGKMVGRSVTTALSDFYAINTDHKTRVSLSIRNSHGEPLLALASAVDLLQSEEVEAIITAGDSILQTKLLAEIGEKAKVPVISINSPISPSLSRYSHLIQATLDSSSEAKGITAFIHGFDWKSVGLVYEDDDDWRESMQLMVDHFYEEGVGVESKAGFAVSSTEEMVMDRLGKMKDLGTSVFVVHSSEVIATRLFTCAERLGMMGERFAWILTAKSMSSSFHGKEAMEGVVGFKTYIPMSRELQNFTLRLRTSLGNGDGFRLSVSGVWAHDVAWALARSAEMVNASSTLLEAITECRFKGLSGDFQVKDKMFLSDKFEIVNLLESGFCIEVFQAAIAPFNYDLEFIPWRNGSNYDNLAIALSTQKDKYDAAVGDITITANRAKYVDFTMPFTDMGLGIVAPRESSMWVFFHPLTRDLWITSAAFFVLTGTLVWLIERPDNKEFQGSWPKQIGVIFWFGFSTLVYAHREKLQHNLSRFVVTVWIFAVLILTTSYTATLTSMMTVQQIRFNSNKDHVGHLSGSLIANMSLTSPKFRSTNTKGLNTSKEYAQALLDNTVSFVVDELPYLKVLIGENPEKFLMVKAHCNTIGFGFMFQKGDDLVHRVSMEILKLRESDKISEMEKTSFESKLPYTADDTSNPLTLYMFRGLFMITGVSSALALALLLITWLRDNWDDLMNSVDVFLSRRLVHFRILCATSIHPNPLDDENAVQMAQRN